MMNKTTRKAKMLSFDEKRDEKWKKIQSLYTSLIDDLRNSESEIDIELKNRIEKFYSVANELWDFVKQNEKNVTKSMAAFIGGYTLENEDLN